MSFFDIKADEINVKYGMYSLCDEREAARGSLQYILSDFADIKQSYFRLGFHLDEFIRCKYYEDFGYLTFKDFALENIPLDYSSINRCINVFNMTCQHADGIGGAKQMFMQDKYKDYSYSQLVEMVSMDDDQLKQVKPTMSVRQIRNIKNVLCDSSSVVPLAPTVLDVPEVKEKNCDVAIGKSIDDIIDDFIMCLENKNGGIIAFDSSTVGTNRYLSFNTQVKQYKVVFMISDTEELKKNSKPKQLA